MIDAILNYRFMQYAIIACILASIVCGIIGVIVIQKKLVMMSSGIAHTAYGGVGLGYLLGFEPMLGAVAFSVIAALGIGFTNRKGNSSDVTIAMFWSLGMALGIFFIGLMSGYPPNLNSYLFGNILSVTTSDLKIMSFLVGASVLIFLIFFNDWKTYLFDSEFAKLRGVNTTLLEYLLLILIALTVVTLIRIAGIILVLALLTTPASTAGLLSKKFKTRMILSIIFGMIFCFFGIWISYSLGIASGASIIIFSIIFYLAVYLVKTIIEKTNRKKINI